MLSFRSLSFGLCHRVSILSMEYVADAFRAELAWFGFTPARHSSASRNATE